MRASLALLLLCCTLAPSTTTAEPPRVLRACADPNNLPFSNARGEGFENALAALLAEELHAQLEMVWWAQRRGFVRNTLKEGLCDVLLGVPSELERVTTTKPYYRSTYVFVTRRDRGLPVRSLDAPTLRTARIGVHLIGDDMANTPAAHALGRRGIVDNVRGYTIYGDYADESPPQRLLEAVDRGDIDVAIAWGPLAGFYAQRAAHPLVLTPVSPARDQAMRFAFDISVAVKKGNVALRDELDRALARRHDDVLALLTRFGIPRV
jgi:quinoprotein dehydrogenase-associated probable ABC transporter substrate-binding protein